MPLSPTNAGANRRACSHGLPGRDRHQPANCRELDDELTAKVTHKQALMSECNTILLGSNPQNCKHQSCNELPFGFR